MFDLALTPSQRSWLTASGSLEHDLQDLAAAAEHDRKPSIEILNMILAGRFPIPTAASGGADPVAIVMAASRYAHADPGAALAIVGSWHVPLLLEAAGSAAQRAAYGAWLHQGSGWPVSAALIYEGFGRQPSEYTTTATRSGGDWILNGRKDSVLHPGVAGCCVVLARDTGRDRMDAFLLDGAAPGLTVERDDAVEGKLGLRAAHTGVVRLDGVKVSETARLENPSDGLAVDRAVALCRATLAGVALGCARASLDYAIEWAKVRSTFGKPIASYQGVSFVLVDLETAIDTAQLLLWDTVTRTAGLTDVAELEDRVARAVGRATTAAVEAGRQGVNLLGVHGIVTEHPVERWYRGSAALSAIDFDPLSVALEVA